MTETLKITKASSSFYGAARYVENDVRNSTNTRNALEYGHYGRITYPGDWRVDLEEKTLSFAFRGAFNRRTTQMKGAYPEYHNDVNMEVAVVPLEKPEDLRQLATRGIKITPYVETIIQHVIDYRDGKILPEEVGLSESDRARKAEQRAAAAEKAIHDATNLPSTITVGGPLKLKR